MLNKKGKRTAFPSYHRIPLSDQPAEIADVGQTAAQAPQSMQRAGSMTYWVSPAEIAPTGHSLSQEPQEMHASEIT